MTPRSGRLQQSTRWSIEETISGVRTSSDNPPGVAPLSSHRHLLVHRPGESRDAFLDADFRLSMRADGAAQRADRFGCGCSRHPHPNATLSGVLIVPADGTRAATVGNGDFGTSPIFGQLSDKPLLACIWLGGVSGAKH